MDRVTVLAAGDRVAVALADGAGGMASGHLAAEDVVGSLGIEAVASWITTGGATAAAGLHALDRRLARSRHGGQCTAVLLGMGGGRLAGASVGDSSAWCSDRGSMLDLTRAQHRKPLVGSGRAAAVAFSAAFEGGRVLVASDGLFHYASADEIWAAATTGTVAQAAARLVELLRLPGRALWDDVSIALLSCPEEG